MMTNMKGRGAQINVKNRFLKNEYAIEHIEGIDIPIQGRELIVFF